ncbi:Retrovirus-related Pol polyprotein from transposon 412 [Frankliniella fusca]|uniref:RNA-directed DNA polymerase n=1 Tax=Frankliniella fusca TaxID=407009 RepID=A0AAE1L6T1_9NEOP|nr:Retrovirus-related Pol polyprotein from transposon 412 [Frankliniella fusca]
MNWYSEKDNIDSKGFNKTNVSEQSSYDPLAVVEQGRSRSHAGSKGSRGERPTVGNLVKTENKVSVDQTTEILNGGTRNGRKNGSMGKMNPTNDSFNSADREATNRIRITSEKRREDVSSRPPPGERIQMTTATRGASHFDDSMSKKLSRESDDKSTRALESLGASVDIRHQSGKMDDPTLSVCEDVNLCSCCYESEDLEKILAIDWNIPIKTSHPVNCFPIRVKVNGTKLLALIDEEVSNSIIAPHSWLDNERIQMMDGKLEINGNIIQVQGIFNPELQISAKIKISLPTLVAQLPEGVDLILGKNFLKKVGGFKIENPAAYSFCYKNEVVKKYKAQDIIKRDWETMTVSESDSSKLFKIKIGVDGLQLNAIVDIGAVRSIINSKYCTNRAGLEPVKLKLRSANDTQIKVEGTYKAALTIENCTVHHNIIAADLPGDVPMLLGNDFLAKYRADTSWNTETLTLRVGVSTIVTSRVRDDESVNSMKVNTPESDEGTVFLCSKSDVEIAPGMCEMVKVNNIENILPAVLSPCVVLGNLDVSSIECLILEHTNVPIFNCSEYPIRIPKGTKIAYITPDNQRIETCRLTKATPSEIAFAVENKILTLEGMENLSSENCLLVDDGGDEPIPSLDGADISEDEKEEVRNVCRKYPDVFTTGMKPHAPVPNFIGHLERTNEESIYRRQWPLSAKQKAIAKKEIQKFLDWGVVEEGDSIVHMPFFVIEKRGSTLENPVGRCLYDCRYLNKVLVKPKFKSYTINDILSYCSDKKLLCTLDINHYFFNIAVTDESKLLLGFTFEGRSLRWTRLPQGLALSPQISINALGKIFKNLPIKYYVDDIILGENDPKSLLLLLDKVLERLRESNLTVDPRKANLFKRELPIIGLTVKAGEYVKPNPSRFRPLLALKEPKNAKELRSVVMFFSYYRRWIKSFAVTTQKYQDMINEKIPFEWNNDDRKWVEDLYQYLLSNATLALFHEDRPTKLHCDASQHSLGAFLAQKSDNIYKPVAYFSAPIKGRKLTWSAFHKECLGLYESVKYFEDELRLLNKFTVVTDCSSIKYLLSMDAPKSPFDKFISFLSNFNFDFELVRSEQNKVPDSLSRLKPPTDTEENVTIPQALITPLKLIKENNELNANVRLGANQTRVPVKKIPVFCLPDGSEQVDLEYVENSTEPITSFIGDFDFLSNFYPVEISFEGNVWPSVEHAFQAAKTDNIKDKERIRNARSPKLAKQLGRFVNLKDNWDSLRNQVMLDLLLIKFSRNDLASKLYDTGERELIEGNYWCDMYWGQCFCSLHRNEIGLNRLGKLLAQIRGFQRDCPNLIPDIDDRKNMILAVTRSRAKDLQPTVPAEKFQQVDGRIIDHNLQPTGDQNTGCAQSVAGTIRTPAIGTPRESGSRQSQPKASDVIAERAADDTTWRQADILNSKDVIKDFSDDCYCLSNYAPSTFVLDGDKYLSVQDALDSKGFHFNDPKYLLVENTNSALEKIRAKFNEITRKTATEFFIKCLCAKFQQNKDLKEGLLKTEGKLLLYCNKICDNYLGLCQCSSCKSNNNLKPLNLLGVELMKLRTRFVKEEKLVLEAERLENIPPIEKFKEYQRNDPELSVIIGTFNPDGSPTETTERYKGVPKFALRNGLLVTNTKIPRTVIPIILLPKIFNDFHSVIGHAGRDIMSLAIRKFYYHRKLDDKISEFVNSCTQCQEYKPSKERYGLLRRKIATNIFHSLTSDFCHISSKAYYKYCLVITDNFSNLTYLYPCFKADHRALQEGLNDFFSKFGRARFVSIDAGPQSKSAEFLEYAKKNGFKIITAASGAHMSVGRVESHVKKLVSVLRFLVDGKASRLEYWHQYIKAIQFHINNSPQIATNGLSPNEIVFGRSLDTPLTIKTTLPNETSIQRRIKLLEQVRNEVRNARDRAFARYSRYYNRNRKEIVFKRGEKVFVKFEKKASVSNPIKFQKFYREGSIKKKLSKVVYLVTLRRRNGIIWRRRCHVSHLKKAYNRPMYLQDKGDIVLLMCQKDVALPCL